MSEPTLRQLAPCLRESCRVAGRDGDVAPGHRHPLAVSSIEDGSGSGWANMTVVRWSTATGMAQCRET